MLAEQVAQVRRFNRLVTQRIGALYDHFLGRDRPLGASRLLYEIGPQGADLRDLRRRLGLDAGYISRLAKTLAGEGLVRLGQGSGDQRVRKARRIPSGFRGRRIRGLWRREGHRAGRRLLEAHVGCRLGARVGDRAAHAGRPRGPGSRAWIDDASPGDEQGARRGDRAVPERRLPRGGAVQRRSVRPPLVREATRTQSACVSTLTSPFPVLTLASTRSPLAPDAPPSSGCAGLSGS